VRFVICVDVADDDPISAYQKLHTAMSEVESKTDGGIQWESTDEAYDDEGEEIPIAVLNDARTSS